MSSSQPSAGRGRKSRIVIDVSRVQDEARKRRAPTRRRRLLSIVALAVAGLLLVALAGGYAWWRSFQRGPAYSLALLVDAAQRDDVQAVEGLIDSDRIAEGFVPQVIEKLTAGGVAGLQPQARAAVTAALPQLLPRVRETMREEIAREVKGFAERGGDGQRNFLLLALGIPRVAEIKEEGETAAVKFNAGEQRAVELSMQRSGDRWKVVHVKDEELAASIAARLAASLPPPGQPATPNQPRRRATR